MPSSQDPLKSLETPFQTASTNGALCIPSDTAQRQAQRAKRRKSERTKWRRKHRRPKKRPKPETIVSYGLRRCVAAGCNATPRAEGTRFFPPAFRNSLRLLKFSTKPFQRKDLARSGRSLSFPVVACCKGSPPGQFLDNSDIGSNGDRPYLPALPICYRRSPLTRPYRRRRLRNKSPRQLQKEDDVRRWEAEIDALVAQHNDELPRSAATSFGAIYARYSTDQQNSVVDQVRNLLEFATKERIYVSRDKVFVDYGIRGASEKRPGLDRLKAATKGRTLQTLLVFSTNRLYRKLYKAIRYVEEEIVERQLRCIFVSQKIDTADTKKWRLLLSLYGMMDEAYSGAFSDNIRAAHQGLARERCVHGTIPFGYKGVEIPGMLTKQKKPRRMLHIDEVTGEWVKRIFDWFACSGMSIDEIARRLNDDPNSPRPEKSLDGLWAHGSVRRLLANPRYRGFVIYGQKESRWLSAKDYVRQFEREEPLYVGQFEELRLVSDGTWFQVQQRLAKLCPNRGRTSANDKRRRLSRLFNGLFVCPAHGLLYQGGAGGGVLYCPDCRLMTADKRQLFTLLDRELALQAICRTVRDLLTADENLVSQIVRCCREAASQLQRPDQSRIQSLKSQEAEKSRQIEFAIRHPGETEPDQAQTLEVVNKLRRERAEIQAELGSCTACLNQPIRIPTEEEARAELQRIDEIMASDLKTLTEEKCGLIRALIDLITGGTIELQQMGERKKHQGWLRGSFNLRLAHVIGERLVGGILASHADETTIGIDFIRPNPLDVLAEEAKRLFDKNMLAKDIASTMNCSRSQITKLLKHWHESRGLTLRDGRGRRWDLPRDPAALPLHQRLADLVMQRYDANLPLQTIASELNCDRNVVTAAIQFWHESRGLPIPDGRARRRILREAAEREMRDKA